MKQHQQAINRRIFRKNNVLSRLPSSVPDTSRDRPQSDGEGRMPKRQTSVSSTSYPLPAPRTTLRIGGTHPARVLRMEKSRATSPTSSLPHYRGR